MLMRGLLVLLLALNAGVAAWWVLHDEPPRAKDSGLPPDVPRLEVVQARGGDGDTVAPSRCYRFGPFTAPAALETARAVIAGEVAWTATAVQVTSPPRGWQVVLAQPSRAAAVATAARIATAGFTDYLVMPDAGADANTIALGRYRNEASARDRAQALVIAGFAATIEPVGGRQLLWLDVAARPAFTPVSQRLGLTGEPIDCAGVLRDARYTVPAPA